MTLRFTLSGAEKSIQQCSYITQSAKSIPLIRGTLGRYATHDHRNIFLHYIYRCHGRGHNFHQTLHRRLAGWIVATHIAICHARAGYLRSIACTRSRINIQRPTIKFRERNTYCLVKW